ncbi:hypothetical protein PPYR_09198 [Photinus pyralis]|uniref:Luciferin 4-monooxygenase n=1 Tax=Photinus pyralis TaxID=7054 RepID=A0A5N4ALH0_PHOPY|nr:4-coumarate--CoA ligase 1-like [Photinus pyralis]XP_031345090.1 4-coumarate--CoA ligase 1-like [Photinus pyralis]KAB0798205.1 hypothetical protein PPYR_09198 [Photinus pyralis]
MEATLEGNIIKMPDLKYIPKAKGVGRLYFDCMSKYKENVAQIDGLTGSTDTFAQLLSRCIRVAIGLKEMGLKSGEIVSVCTLNHLNSCVPMIASFFLGAIVSAVDVNFRSSELAFLLKQAPPKVIFVQENVVPKVESALATIGSDAIIVVFGDHSGHVSFAELLKDRSEEKEFKPKEVENLYETVSICFSSGTSGPPKGVCYNHYTMMYLGSDKAHGSCDSVLSVSFATPYWVVFLLGVHFHIVKGITRLVYPQFDPSNAWQTFTYPITSGYFNVAHILSMLKEGRPNNIQTDSVTDIMIGGNTVPGGTILAMKALLPNARVRLVYGQTEIPMSIASFNPLNPIDLRFIEEKPTSVGRGVPGVWYKIVDFENGAALGPNTPGELRIKTKMQTNGYYNLDSSQIWDESGWLKTGDLAYYDEDLCFFILGRVKEMFKYREWHVIPSVLEGILNTHPAVESVAVIGVPHEMDGHHPKAVVVLKPSHQSTSEEEIEKFVEETVSDSCRLRGGVKFVSELPLTVTGKIIRKQVEEMFS